MSFLHMLAACALLLGALYKNDDKYQEYNPKFSTWFTVVGAMLLQVLNLSMYMHRRPEAASNHAWADWLQALNILNAAVWLMLLMPAVDLFEHAYRSDSDIGEELKMRLAAAILGFMGAVVLLAVNSFARIGALASEPDYEPIAD